jgi:hypothetical protein
MNEFSPEDFEAAARLARDEEERNVLPFEPLPPKVRYQPSPMNGEVWTIGTPGDYAILHYSSSGNSADLIEGFKTLAEAESAAWREARRWQAIFLDERKNLVRGVL